MGTGVRDVDVGGEVQDLAAYGYFAEEIAYFGCAYVQKGRIYYRLNEQEARLWQFADRAQEMGITPTPIAQQFKRVSIPSGQREQVKEEVRLAFVQTLKQMYPRAYFELLGPLAKTCATNAAAELLGQWQGELAACFEEEAYQLFGGAVRLAYASKLLQAGNYQQMMAWLEDRLNQIQQQNRAKGAYKRVFGGFAYRDGNDWRYFCDANELAVRRKHAQWLQKGVVTTPIFQRQYELSQLRTGDVAELEKQFEQTMSKWLDETYLNRFVTLKRLPSAIDHALYDRQAEKAQQLESPQARAAFAYWCFLWNCAN